MFDIVLLYKRKEKTLQISLFILLNYAYVALLTYSHQRTFISGVDI